MAEEKKLRIGIAIHSCGPIESVVYSNHIAMFAAWAKEFDLRLLTLDRAKVAEARNALTERAIQEDCTHILFLDTDHLVDKNMLKCLLGNKDADVVSGLVCRRTPDKSQIGFIQKDDGLYYSLELATDGMSYSVDACAFGCTLINLKVFEKIKEPWFKDEMITGPDGKLRQRRSDMAFCDEVKKLGGTIRIDTRVLVGHLRTPEVLWPDEKEFQLGTYKKAAELICEHSLTSVLDLGCGFGKKLVKYIKPICDNVMGVDVASSAKYCAETYTDDIAWAAADLEKECKFDQFAMVICADVLEHLKKPEVLVQTIIRSMAKDGYAIVSTPDVSTLSEYCVTNDEHQQFWDKKKFVGFLTDQGLKVIETIQQKEYAGYLSTICVCRRKA